MKKLVIVVLAVLTLAGCGGGGDDGGGGSTPPTIDVTGTWRGSVTQTGFGTGTATLNIVQSGTTVTGAYSFGGTGSVSGSVSGNILNCTISPTGCTGTMEGTGIVTTNSTGQQQMAFSGSGSYVCPGQTFNNTTSVGVLIKQ